MKWNILWVGFICFLGFSLWPEIPQAAIHKEIPLSEWFVTLNTTWNAYHLWRYDPIAQILGITHPITYSWYALSVFTLGALTLVRTFQERIIVLGIPILFLKLFGYDVVVFGALAWVPWLLLSLQHLPSAVALLSTVGIGWLITRSANQLSFLLIPLAILLTAKKGAFPYVFLGLCLFWLIIGIDFFSAPPLPYPDYPPTGSIHSNEGLIDIVRPFFGADVSIPSLNHGVISSLLNFLSLILFLGSFSLLLMQRNRASMILCVLAISLLLDTCFPVDVSIISPLQTLARILPSVSFISLTPLVFALVLAGVLVLSRASSPLFLIVFIAITLVPTSFLQSEKISSISSTSRFVSQEGLAARASFDAERLSPSFALYAQMGSQTISRYQNHHSYEHILPKGIKILTSPESTASEISHMLDRDNGSRWSRFGGKQRGDETLWFRFDVIENIDGVHLASDRFPTDYPRGLEVSYAEKCQEAEMRTISYLPIVQYREWLGAIEFTPLGYPYFGPRQKTRILFPHTIQAQCIRIKQTARFDYADWSIGELRFLKEK